MVNLFKFRLSSTFAFVLIGVPLFAELPVCLFNVLGRGIAAEAENGVEVASDRDSISTLNA